MIARASSLPFRFDAASHTYLALDTGEELPHITGMLEQTGHVDTTWFTEESSERGQIVHKLTADYDLGALDVATCITRHRGYLLAHVQAMTLLRPTILSVEEPRVHPVYRFGGRPDRVVEIDGRKGVLEIKTTEGRSRAHELQTALQTILVSPELSLPAEFLGRWCLYLKKDGRCVLDEHHNRTDLGRAHDIIRACCRG